MVNYRLDGFSVEKLMDFIVALGRDVEIVVRPKRGDAQARFSVLEAVRGTVALEGDIATRLTAPGS